MDRRFAIPLSGAIWQWRRWIFFCGAAMVQLPASGYPDRLLIRLAGGGSGGTPWRRALRAGRCQHERGASARKRLSDRGMPATGDVLSTAAWWRSGGALRQWLTGGTHID